MMRLFPHATDPAAPINSGVRGDVARRTRARPYRGVVRRRRGRIVMGVFMAGVNRALDLPSGQVGEFAQGLGAILLHGLGISRSQAERIMAQAIQSVLR